MKLNVSVKKIPTKIIKANEVAQPIIIGMWFFLTYAEQQLTYIHPDRTKGKINIGPCNYDNRSKNQSDYQWSDEYEEAQMDGRTYYLPKINPSPLNVMGYINILRLQSYPK